MAVSLGWGMGAGVRWGVGGVACAAGFGVLLLTVQAPASQQGLAPEKTLLAGVDVSGKSADEIKQIANDLSSRLLATPLKLRYQKRVLATTPDRLGGKVDVAAAVTAAVAPDPAGNLVDRLRERFSGPDARQVALPVVLTPEAVTKGTARFAVQIGMEPKSAKLTKVAGKFKATPPQPGKELDPAALAASVHTALDEPAYRAKLAEGLLSSASRTEWLKSLTPIELPVTTREAVPQVTLEHLKEITARLSSFRTGMGGSSRNRISNVALACRAIDGTVLLPGDVFSYNDIVGPRVASAGFKEAPVIVKGELQPGIGGGICQVSSTLFNAALLADLQIVRRSHHAFPVHYVPAGRDATVVDGLIDFRFRNNLKHPVAIDAKVSGGSVYFHIYGHPADKREVELERGRISVIPAAISTVSDPRLPKGRRVVEKRAKSGQRVTLYRIVKQDGKELRRETVSRSAYRAFPGVVRVGTREVAKAVPSGAPSSGPSLPAAPMSPSGTTTPSAQDDRQ